MDPMGYMLSMLLRNSWFPTFRIFQGGHQTTVPRHPRGPPAPHPKSPVVESSRGWRLRSSCLGHTPGYFDFGEKYENSSQAKSKQWVGILKPGSFVKFRQNTQNLTRMWWNEIKCAMLPPAMNCQVYACESAVRRYHKLWLTTTGIFTDMHI
jgi:hypothetical protein